MALRVIAFDRSEEMWQRLREDWQRDKGALLFAGSFARQQFEKSLEETVFAARTYTLPEFWQELAKLLDIKEKALASNLEEEVIARFAKNFPKLSLLSGSSLADLISHLQQIEYQADRDFSPTNPLEEEIESLRKLLPEQGIYTQASFRTLLSRRSKEVDLNYPLFVTHLPEPSRQLTGMLKGLSRKNDIFYYPLMSESSLGPYLDLAGFSDYSLEENFSKRDLALLFSADKTGAEEKKKDQEVAVSLFSSAQEEEVALDMASRLLEKGETGVALVVPGGEKGRERLLQKARDHGISLAYRLASEARATLIGSLLLSLSEAQKEDRLEESWRDICQDASPLYQLNSEVLQTLVASENFLQDSLSLAESLTKQDNLPAREHLWLANALGKYQDLKNEGVEISDVGEFLLSVLTPRKAYGEGILLLTPAEVPGYQLNHIFFLHLFAGGYPGGVKASPFFSQELLQNVPALRKRDERYTFLAALLAAQKSVSLLRSTKEEPSVYFSEVIRRGYDEKYTEPKLPRTTIQKMARQRKEASEDIEKALRKIAPEVDLEEEELRGKRDFSVTELERYLACPLGWFVENQIGPRKRVNLNQRHGTALHAVMEELLSYGPEEREEKINEVLDRHTDSFLSPRLRSFDQESIRVVLDRYAGDSWPFPEHHLEQFFVLEDETEDGSLVAIKGRMDRLDLRNGEEGKEALLIDYKLNKAASGNLLQISLYPLMVEANLGVKALGFLYVSMMQGNHKGRLEYPIAGISEEGIDYPLQKEAGLLRAKEAIRGIRQGEWFSVGEKCPSWCAHRLLSKTKESF